MSFKGYIPRGGLYDYKTFKVRFNSGETERRSSATNDRYSSRYIETDPIVDTYFDLDRYYGTTTRQETRELSDQGSRRNAVGEDSRRRPSASGYDTRPRTSDSRTQTRDYGSSRTWRTTDEYAQENAASRQVFRSQREHGTTKSSTRAASPDTERLLRYSRYLSGKDSEPRSGAYHTDISRGSRDGVYRTDIYRGSHDLPSRRTYTHYYG